MTVCVKHPKFIHTFKQHWPFAQQLQGCTLVSTRFDPQQLTDEDFINAGVPAPNAMRKRQAEYLSARLCAREALRIQTGQAGLPTQQADTRAPSWPQHTCGSISHSHGISAAIIGDSVHWRSLGMDIEKPIKLERAERLSNTILTATEQEHFKHLDPQHAVWYLTYVFSLKESLFKALNPLTGVYFTFQDAQVLNCVSADSGNTQLRLCKQLSSTWPVGSQLSGYFARLHGSAITLVTVPAGTA